MNHEDLKSRKILPNGMRSLNQPVNRAELEAAERAVLKAAERVQSWRDELERAKQAEAKARAHLSRVRQAAKRSGIAD